MKYRLLFVCCLLAVSSVHPRITPAVQAAVYVKRDQAVRTAPLKGKQLLHYLQLRKQSGKWLRFLLYIALAWTTVYLSILIRSGREASTVQAILIFGLMFLAGIITLFLLLAWLWWLLSRFWLWLFPRRMNRRLSRCYRW